MSKKRIGFRVRGLGLGLGLGLGQGFDRDGGVKKKVSELG
jgi:hypothetical protein